MSERGTIEFNIRVDRLISSTSGSLNTYSHPQALTGDNHILLLFDQLFAADYTISCN
jgi:hypothetical protein